MGVVNFKLSGKLTGDSDIDCGVGKLELVVLGKQEEYTIKAKKGIGDFQVNGRSVADDTTIGNGNYRMEIDAGVGKTEVYFEE